MQLHRFSDASGKAYACVVYLRVIFCNGDILTRFVASISWVAPIKKGYYSTIRANGMSDIVLPNEGGNRVIYVL